MVFRLSLVLLTFLISEVFLGAESQGGTTLRDSIVDTRPPAIPSGAEEIEEGKTKKKRFCWKLRSQGVILGQSWGSLTTQQQKRWIEVSCFDHDNVCRDSYR